MILESRKISFKLLNWNFWNLFLILEFHFQNRICTHLRDYIMLYYCSRSEIVGHAMRHCDVVFSVDVGKLTVSMSKNVVLAPTKEALSLRAYTLTSQMNGLRRASCRLYQQISMTQVVEKLEREIEIERIAVRTDRMLHADLGTTSLCLPKPFILQIFSVFTLIARNNPLALVVGQ